MKAAIEGKLDSRENSILPANLAFASMAANAGTGRGLGVVVAMIVLLMVNGRGAHCQELSSGVIRRGLVMGRESVVSENWFCEGQQWPGKTTAYCTLLREMWVIQRDPSTHKRTGNNKADSIFPQASIHPNLGTVIMYRYNKIVPKTLSLCSHQAQIRLSRDRQSSVAQYPLVQV